MLVRVPGGLKQLRDCAVRHQTLERTCYIRARKHHNELTKIEEKKCDPKHPSRCVHKQGKLRLSSGWSPFRKHLETLMWEIMVLQSRACKTCESSRLNLGPYMSLVSCLRSQLLGAHFKASPQWDSIFTIPVVICIHCQEKHCISKSFTSA